MGDPPKELYLTGPHLTNLSPLGASHHVNASKIAALVVVPNISRLNDLCASFRFKCVKDVTLAPIFQN